MPQHTAIDTDVTPGTNLTELQLDFCRVESESDDNEEYDSSQYDAEYDLADGDLESPFPEPFSSQQTIAFTVAIIMATVFLGVFLAFSYYNAENQNAKRKQRIRIMISDSPSL